MTSATRKPTLLFWIIGIIALIWNGMGVDAYINQAYQTERYKAMYSEEQLEMISNLPSWYTAVFAIAVFSSFVGCILFLLRKKQAISLLFLGLIAVIIQTGYNLFLNPGKDVYGAMEYSMLVMIPLFALFIYWYAKSALGKGYIS